MNETFKIEQLPEVTTIGATDILHVEHGTPGSRADAKIQKLNLLLSLLELTQFPPADELTISADTITATQTTHKLQPQSGTADNLATINGMAEGQVIVLYPSDEGTDTITIKHGTGNIRCIGGHDITLDFGAAVGYYNGSEVLMIGSAPPNTFTVIVTSPATGNLVFYDGADWRSIGGLKDGEMINGKIDVTVASNNLTVALKTRAGNTPSATDPVIVCVNGTYRLITSALTQTRNAGTNWLNAGSAELATLEVDWFVYIGWLTGAGGPGISMLISRLPNLRTFANTVSGATNDHSYLPSAAITPLSSDVVVPIGRFAAILSATPNFNWSLPTFTAENLIQSPIRETRWLTWSPQMVGWTAGNVAGIYLYKLIENRCILEISQNAGQTSNSTNTTMTLPMTAATITNIAWDAPIKAQNNTIVQTAPGLAIILSAATVVTFYTNWASALWTASGTKQIAYSHNEYNILP